MEERKDTKEEQKKEEGKEMTFSMEKKLECHAKEMAKYSGTVFPSQGTSAS